MKTILTFIFLFLSVESFAGTRAVSCQKIPGQSNGAFGFWLDNSDLDKHSSYYRIKNASWAFSYSSAQLICSQDMVDISDKESFKCIGYLFTGSRIEISVNLNQGQGTAKVHNIGRNIYDFQTEGMTLPCRLAEN